MQLIHEIKIFDELAKKRLKIIYYEVESNKRLKYRFVRTYSKKDQKQAQSKNIYRIETEGQSIKPSLKSIKKEIKRVINDCRDN